MTHESALLLAIIGLCLLGGRRRGSVIHVPRPKGPPPPATPPKPDALISDTDR